MGFQLIIVLAVATLATVLVYVVLSRILPGRWRHNEVETSEAFTIDSVNVLIGLLFSILLAFVIGSVLVDYDKARSDAQQEANALGAVYGFARGIPEPAQSTWKQDSRNYTVLVIDQDWPLMQHQQASEAAWTALTTLRNDVYAFKAADAREQNLQNKAMGKVQDIYDARRTRVELVNAGVPDFLWYSLLGGALLVALFSLLTKPHLTGRLLIAVGIQALVITGALYVVSVLNHPFSGDYRVESSAFEILLERFAASP
ncbi:MAG: DUF4239 domain-containing protein [Pseudonocardiaceae bacterium]